MVFVGAALDGIMPTLLSLVPREMAMLPELSRLRVAPPDGQKGWPILQTENVFILPGVPQFFQTKMQTIVDHFLDTRSMVSGWLL